MSNQFSYDVFLSYRHKPLDETITRRVFNALESYRLPKTLHDRGCPDIQRVFRDTEELAVREILTETIDEALLSTYCLVVVCSTDTPSSEWVDREVNMFIRMGRAEHIYPLLISGDPEHSFPPSLKMVPDVMNRLMDVRSKGDDPGAIMARAETALLKVVADIAGCDNDELLREHVLRRNRRFAARTLTALGILAAIVGISMALMRMASNYRDTARVREEASMRILNELTYSLPDHLTNVPGAYSRIEHILRRNTEDLNAIARLSENREAAEFEAAANLEKLASAERVLGAYEESIASEDEAIGIFKELSEAGYRNSGRALASAYNNRGGILSAAGCYEEASADYEKSIGLLTEAEEPLMLGNIYFNAGANAVNLGDNALAEEYFDASLTMLGQAGENPESTGALAKVNYNYGVLLYREGYYKSAEEKLSAACRLFEALREQTDSLQNRSDNVRAGSLLAACLSDQGWFEEADEYYSQAVAAAEELAQDEDNVEFRRLLAEVYNNWGLCYSTRGDWAAADLYYGLASDVCRQMMEKTGSASDTAQFALTLLNIGENAFKAGEYERSRETFSDGLERYGMVCESLGTYDTAQFYAWQSYFRLIHERDAETALSDGLTAWQMQPDSVLVELNLAYACLYCGYYEDADTLFRQVASLGRGQAEAIRRDLEAQKRAGLESEHTEAVVEILSGICNVQKSDLPGAPD